MVLCHNKQQKIAKHWTLKTIRPTIITYCSNLWF